jgi:hypothetical protein
MAWQHAGEIERRGFHTGSFRLWHASFATGSRHSSHSAALDTRDPGRAVSEARPTYRETAVRRRRRERAPARAPQRRCALVVPAPPPSSPAHRLASGRPGGKLWQRFLMGQTLNPTAYTFIPRRARLWEGITTHPCIQAHAHASARSTG